jgi:hypothetical protein
MSSVYSNYALRERKGVRITTSSVLKGNCMEGKGVAQYPSARQKTGLEGESPTSKKEG